MESLEQYESLERCDSPFELSEVQQQMVDLDLKQFSNGEDFLLNGDHTEAVIECYDRSISRMRPDLKTPVNLSPMKSFNPSWEHFIDGYLAPPYLEAFSNREQVEQISDYMSSIEAIRPENWKKYTLKEQLSILNEMEQHIAVIAHRPALPIYAEAMDDRTFGYQRHDKSHPSDDKIAINIKVFEAANNNPELLYELLDTLIHEGRHQYQHYNVEVRVVHDSLGEVESWRENFEDYGYYDGSPVTIMEFGPIGLTNNHLREVGGQMYYMQPVEVDARAFAFDVMHAYKEKMAAYHGHN